MKDIAASGGHEKRDRDSQRLHGVWCTFCQPARQVEEILATNTVSIENEAQPACKVKV